MSIQPGCFNNPRPASPPYQTLSPPTDYQTAPPLTPNVSPPLSPIVTPGISPSKLLLTPKSSPPHLTSPPPALTQPSKHSSPLAINLDLVELIFLTPPTSRYAFFDSLSKTYLLEPQTLHHLDHPSNPSNDWQINLHLFRLWNLLSHHYHHNFHLYHHNFCL